METLADSSLNIAIRSAVFHLPGGELVVLAGFGGAELPVNPGNQHCTDDSAGGVSAPPLTLPRAHGDTPPYADVND